MARSIFERLVLEKTLSALDGGDLRLALDHAVDGPQSDPAPFEIPAGLTDSEVKDLEAFRSRVAIPTKNVCAKVHPDLSKQIDDTCAILGINKRRFLEAAFIDALDRAHRIMEDEGLMDSLREHAA